MYPGMPPLGEFPNVPNGFADYANMPGWPAGYPNIPGGMVSHYSNCTNSTRGIMCVLTLFWAHSRFPEESLPTCWQLANVTKQFNLQLSSHNSKTLKMNPELLRGLAPGLHPGGLLKTPDGRKSKNAPAMSPEDRKVFDGSPPGMKINEEDLSPEERERREKERRYHSK